MTDRRPIEGVKAMARHLVGTMAASLLVALWTAACQTPVGVERLGRQKAFREVTANVLVPGVPSEASKQILARYDLLDLFGRDAEQALQALHAQARGEPRRAELVALAELSFLRARESGGKAHDLAAVVYAYFALFGEGVSGVLAPYDPRVRLVSDLYNSALTEALISGEGEIVLESGARELPFGTMTIQLNRAGFPWGARGFDRFLPAWDFRVRGLDFRQRTPGLGVPLIAARSSPPDPEAPSDYLPPFIKVAASAFLRVAGGWDDVRRGELSASLELYDPIEVPAVEIHGRRAPLEADLTAPLAYGLEESPVWQSELRGFLSAEAGATPPGLYMIRPYSPGKLPVVFVHGTASSPARWAPMVNSLQAYPELRQAFQYWLFNYRTGNPIVYSAHLLREALREAVDRLDPRGTDPALRRMVVIGHSQGGIVTKLVAVDSGSRFWDRISSAPLEALELSDAARALVRQVVFFERVPQVRRVVFISTPHRGSFLARPRAVKLAASALELPGNVLRLGGEVLGKLQDEEALALSRAMEGVPTSIEGMAPDNPFLETLVDIPIPPEVTGHSIIAVKGASPVEEGDDGVVKYSSAHLDGVASEFVVRSGHSAQGHPLVIREVRRILREHLSLVPGEPSN